MTYHEDPVVVAARKVARDAGRGGPLEYQADAALSAYGDAVALAVLREVGCKYQSTAKNGGEWVNGRNQGGKSCLEAKSYVIDFGPAGDEDYMMGPEAYCKPCRLIAEIEGAQ